MTLSHLPVVSGSNLLGHAHLFKDDRLAFLRSACSAGELSRIRFLRRWVVIVSSPEHAHQVLVERASSFEKAPALRLVLRDLAGDGLFTSDGELWRRQRRLMSPLFHASQLSTYASTMNGVARRAIDRLLAQSSEGVSVDLARELTRITMGVVGATLFGADTSDEADDIGHALTVALKWVDDTLASTMLTLQATLIETAEKLRPAASAPVPQMLFDVRQRIEDALREPFLLPGRDGEVAAAIRTLDKRIGAMIDDRRARPNDRADLLTRLLLARDSESPGNGHGNGHGNAGGNGNGNGKGNGHGGHGEGMSDKQLRDEANTLFVAGHETTANALAWSFYLLARHPEARARVQAEADGFGPEGPTSFEPERLAYTTRVFKEALRLYPPLVLLGRRSREPFELGGRSYPARTLVFVSTYGIHTSSAVWPDPDRFDPDRFTPEREAARHKSAWIPFGVGPRVCIGNYFALMEGPIVLATLMRRARFDIDPDRVIEPDAIATLRPRGGLPAIVSRVSDS
jgi:cytochrome P450